MVGKCQLSVIFHQHPHARHSMRDTGLPVAYCIHNLSYLVYRH